jgi:cbb3-type cytochrome oxidase maturation protein
MSALYLLIAVSLLMAVGFLVAFVRSVRAGQFDDTATPPLRMLGEEDGRPVGVEKGKKGAPDRKP